MEKLVSLAKRRGIIFQSSEIYGGAAASYDYGPLGVELKQNIKREWWKEMTRRQDNIVGLDSAILAHPRVWEASGHIENFSDPLAECASCRRRFRADHIEGDASKCPECGGKLGQARKFNLMFKTFLGPVEDEASTIYLRPETAQGIYVDARTVSETMRLKIPFGIAQIGKAFRNEITPGNFTFRTVEFEQMEMQFFVKPEEAPEYFKKWREQRLNWYRKLGVKEKNLRLRPHAHDELSHYAKAAQDIEYNYPFGWKELEGIHNRGDWDLSRHSKYSGKDLSFFDNETKDKFIPYIVETSAGADRAALMFLLDAFCESDGADGCEKGEIVLRLHQKLAPVKVAVLPLVKNKEPLVKKADEIYRVIKEKFPAQYDETGSIGRRYRRQDEIGTPWCVTIDFQTLEDNTITLRERDTMKQERMSLENLIRYCSDRLK